MVRQRLSYAANADPSLNPGSLCIGIISVGCSDSSYHTGWVDGKDLIVLEIEIFAGKLNFSQNWAKNKSKSSMS